MSIEVWNYKFMPELSTMMIVGLCGSVLTSLHSNLAKIDF